MTEPKAQEAPLHPLPDLSGLSDAELFALREPDAGARVRAVQGDRAALEALAARLGPQDLFTVARVALVRSHRYEEDGEHAKAIRVITEYLARFEPLHPRLNMAAYVAVIVPLYARVGDLTLERAGMPSHAADFYLRILALGGLRRTNPFVMLLAASRIVRGAALRFRETDDPKQLRHAQYGARLFRFAVECAYDSTGLDFETWRLGPDAFELQKPHFFREIARESAVISEAMAALDERLAALRAEGRA